MKDAEDGAARQEEVRRKTKEELSSSLIKLWNLAHRGCLMNGLSAPETPGAGDKHVELRV